MKPTILLALLGLFAACGPRILVPAGTPAYMVRPYETQEIDQVIVHIENLVMRGDHLLFDIEIENNSEQKLGYHPQTMYYQAYDKNGHQKPNNSAAYQTGSHSLHPLQWQIPAYGEMKAQHFMKHKISSQKAGKTFLDLLVIGLIINEAVQESRDYQQSDWTAEDAERAETRAAVNFATQTALAVTSNVMAESIESHSWEREDIEYDYLGPGILDPGESVRGLVMFPKRINAASFHIHIPLGESLFEFIFEKPS